MLPIATIERIVRKAGVKRISSDAVEEIAKTVEEIGTSLALDAAQAARHAKRKTLLREDIRLVSGKS